jgi:glycosyltransferase involved in cell wall biosynthesis
MYKKYNKILIVCPEGAVTGGPEALHQLAAHMNSFGLPAYMCYQPFDKPANAPSPYERYDTQSAPYEDTEGNLIIFPEIQPMLALKVKHARAALWWLSLENFLERRHTSKLHDKLRYFKRIVQGRRPLGGASKLKSLLHFSQTEHATQYLRNCGIEPIPLIDSINEDFLTDRYLDRIDHKKNTILYNPAKGWKVTRNLIATYPELNFVPVRGLSREQLSDRLYDAKIYIDFGHHPGRDRMPREAAMHGCACITGILGSAGNDIDLPISKTYKLDSAAPDFVKNFGELVTDMMQNFPLHYGNFASYRKWVQNESIIFRQQIFDYFINSNNVNNVLASVLLLTYNQESLVEGALVTLLEQDIDQLEIIVSDDNSVDNTWGVIQRVVANYLGPKKIITNRNLTNIGIVANYNQAFQLSQGELIFTAAGDDIYLPTRCSSCIKLWLEKGRMIDLIACDAFDMAETGKAIKVKRSDKLENWDKNKWLKRRPFIFGAGHMVTRRLLDIGSLNSDLPYEDQCVLFRALQMGGAATISSPLLYHRRGGISQQGVKDSYDEKIQKLISSAKNSQTEATQMLLDALVFRCEENIVNTLRIQKEMSEFVQNILLEDSLLRKIKLFISTKNIPWIKKFRFLQFSTLSFLHRPLMQISRL